MEHQYNRKSPAVKRLMREAAELSEPTEQYHAQPLEDNLFEWHFTIRGPVDSEFDGGIYHGRIILPPEYPMKPPSIILLTPNGRFEVLKKICLSISGHHPESWQPSWSIRTALLAIIGFMPTHGSGAIGSLDYTADERKILAKKSLDHKCPECGSVRNILLPVTAASDKTRQEAKELASQIAFQGEKEKSKSPESGGDGSDGGTPPAPPAAAAAAAAASPSPTAGAGPGGAAAGQLPQFPAFPGFPPQGVRGQHHQPGMPPAGFPPFAFPGMFHPSAYNPAACGVGGGPGSSAPGRAAGMPGFWPPTMPAMMAAMSGAGNGSTQQQQQQQQNMARGLNWQHFPAWPPGFNPQQTTTAAGLRFTGPSVAGAADAAADGGAAVSQATDVSMSSGGHSAATSTHSDTSTTTTTTTASPATASSPVPTTTTTSASSGVTASSSTSDGGASTASSSTTEAAPPASTADPASPSPLPLPATTTTTSTTPSASSPGQPTAGGPLPTTTPSSTPSHRSPAQPPRPATPQLRHRAGTNPGGARINTAARAADLPRDASRSPCNVLVTLLMVFVGLIFMVLLTRRLYVMHIFNFEQDPNDM